mgnify:CR=1 FL=1
MELLLFTTIMGERVKTSPKEQAFSPPPKFVLTSSPLGVLGQLVCYPACEGARPVLILQGTGDSG